MERFGAALADYLILFIVIYFAVLAALSTRDQQSSTSTKGHSSSDESTRTEELSD